MGMKEPGMPTSRDAEQAERVWSSGESADCDSGAQGTGLGSLLLYLDSLSSPSFLGNGWVG